MLADRRRGDARAHRARRNGAAGRRRGARAVPARGARRRGARAASRRRSSRASWPNKKRRTSSRRAKWLRWPAAQDACPKDYMGQLAAAQRELEAMRDQFDNVHLYDESGDEDEARARRLLACCILIKTRQRPLHGVRPARLHAPEEARAPVLARAGGGRARGAGPHRRGRRLGRQAPAGGGGSAGARTPVYGGTVVLTASVADEEDGVEAEQSRSSGRQR